MCWIRLVVMATLACCLPAFAQQRTVAIPVDDLPFVGHTGAVTDGVVTVAGARLAREVNQKLLRAFKKHRVPVTGFVKRKARRSSRAQGWAGDPEGMGCQRIRFRKPHLFTF